jgi:hypothetical protein
MKLVIAKSHPLFPGLVLPCGQKLTLAYWPPSFPKWSPSASIHFFQSFFHFKVHPGNSVLWGCLASPAILPRSLYLCQNGGLSILSSTGEAEKSRVDLDDCLVNFFVKNFLVEKEVWDGLLSWCNSQFFCLQSSARSLRKFWSCCRKLSQ